VLYEYDQLKKRTGVPPAERLAALEQYPALLDRRDDLYIELITLHNHLGQPERALELMLSHRFHPWEGGETLVAEQYDTARLLLGRKALAAGKPQEALAHLEAARRYPANLGVARFRAMPDAHLRYYTGAARAAAGDRAGAAADWRAGAGGEHTFPFERYYRAMAQRALGDEAAARDELQGMLADAEAHLNDEVGTGYFGNYYMALLLFEEDLTRLNHIQQIYLAGLAKLGLGRIEEARRDFETVLSLDPNHMAAQQEMDHLPVA
jgi:tetratricopeptide (TPR) repeat protein